MDKFSCSVGPGPPVCGNRSSCTVGTAFHVVSEKVLCHFRKSSFCTVETASTVGTFRDMGTVLSGLNKQDPLDYGSKSSGAVRTGPFILWGLVTVQAVFNLRKRSFWIVEKSPHVLLVHCRGHVGLKGQGHDISMG